MGGNESLARRVLWIVKTPRADAITPSELSKGETIVLDTVPPCSVTVLSVDRRSQTVRVREESVGDYTLWFRELRGARRPRRREPAPAGVPSLRRAA